MSGTVSTQRGKLLIVLGIAISGALLYVAAAGLSIDKMIDTVAHARLWPWLPFAVLSYLIGHWVRGLRLSVLVSKETNLSLTTGTNIIVLGYAVNNILPFRMGELARMGMLFERTGIPFMQSASVTVLERVLDGLTIVFLLAASMLAVTVDGWMFELLTKASLIFGIALSGVLLLVLRPRWVVSVASRMSGSLVPQKQNVVLRTATSVTAGVSFLQRASDAVVIAMLSVAVWLCEAGMFWALLPALGLEANPMVAMMAMAVTNLGILVPSTPGYIGVFHFVCMKALMLTGVIKATALAYAVLVHLAFFIPITLWGVGVILWYGVKLSSTIALAQAARQARILKEQGGFSAQVIAVQKSSTRKIEASEFMVALAVACLPAAFPGILPDEQDRIVRRVAQFVQGQMEALPLKLRILFATGAFGFRLLTAIRYQRLFCKMELEKQRKVFEAWAYGPVGLARKLFRPIRSTALLAYYENPIIEGALNARSQASPQARRCDCDG
jgi:uncharacterized protein (TIRG00374 family)